MIVLKETVLFIR